MDKIIKQLRLEVDSPELINEALTILRKNFRENKFLFSHSLRVGLILKKMGVTEEIIVSGILHHIPESRLSLKEIEPKTRTQILTILKKVNQLKELCSSQKHFKPRPIKKWQKLFVNEQAENLRRMCFAITKDLRPLFVSLATRLDEMKNLQYFSKEQQQKKSVEALEVFAPLAYGIGMGEIKGQLEDLAFPALYPKEYNWLISNVKEEYVEREKYLQKLKPLLKEILTKEEIETLNVHARAKHYFSLYQKLLRYGMDIEKIYDLVALRIIVPDITTCYRVLGAIHKTWSPLQGRIKDYISSPKSNGYRSLHTTVFCEQKKIVEFQVKTQRMHQEAEYGAAAHLGYKEKNPQKGYKYQFYWLDRLRKWREEIKDLKKISKYLQTELFNNRIFILTPEGDVINLPKGSTPVDLAYAVHTEIGDRCQGAKVNGKIAPLNRTLKNSETVEIITDKNKTPSSDWLRFVKTDKARGKIKSFLQKAYGISPQKAKKPSVLQEKVSFLRKILPIKKKKEPQVYPVRSKTTRSSAVPPTAERTSNGVSIAGETGISIKFSRCCSPNPKDQIKAFITKGEGASLHKIDCKNLKELEQKWPQRIVTANWRSEKKRD